MKSWLSRKILVKELTGPYRSAIGKSRGKIIVRHRATPLFCHFHNLDNFKLIWNVYGQIVGFEKSPVTQAYVALVAYPLGILSYTVAVAGLGIGDKVLNGSHVPIRKGNATCLYYIPLNTKISFVESFPGSGSVFVKTPGNWALVQSKNDSLAKVVFRSGSIKFLNLACLAVVGRVGNIKWKLRKFRKAGDLRRLGKRPEVRGVAKNPVDHPHGGGKGKKSKNAVPEGPWGRSWRRKKANVKVYF